MTCFDGADKLIEWLGFSHLESLYRPLHRLEDILLEDRDNYERGQEQVQLLLASGVLLRDRWLAGPLCAVLALLGKEQLLFAVLLGGQVGSLPAELLVDFYMAFSMPLQCYYHLREKGQVP